LDMAALHGSGKGPESKAGDAPTEGLMRHIVIAGRYMNRPHSGRAAPGRAWFG
jgi:hypothetical protein